MPWTDGVIYDDFGTSVRKTAGNPVLSLASYRVFSQISATNNWQMWIDGGSLFSTETNTTGWGASPKIGWVTFGAQNYYIDGDIAEILVFPTALSTEDRQSVERYLAKKWALTLA
jgi:hypothetical protein